MYGRINFCRIDTTPGQCNAFAPPEGFADDYIAYMRQCYKVDPGVRQHVVSAAFMFKREGGKRPQFIGPYADKALALCRKIAK